MNDQELFNRVLEKLENINCEITEIKITLAQQAKSLDYHVKRTDKAEEHIEKLELHINESIKILQQQIEPVKDHVKSLSGIMKFIGTATLVASLVLSVMQIVSFFKH